MKNITITFKSISHTVHRMMCENKTIKLVPKGTVYEPIYSGVFPEEDIVKKCGFWRLKNKCVAKEDRWKSSDYSWFATKEEVIKDWHNHVLYLDDKWYNLGWIEIHFLDGETETLYFNDDYELQEKLNMLNGKKEVKTINL